jgi:nitrogen-specific signal transduction histidine kinase/CheY-like chemotaxis protein
MMQDVTEQKRNQAKLMEAQKMDSIGNLAAGISHDINNVLGGILGYADMISEDTKEEKTRDRAEKIMNSSHRVSNLVEKILAFARGGKNIIKPVDMNSAVKEVYSLLKRSVEKTISLEQTLQEDLYNIDADPTQIHQVLLNLCVNASQAMPNGGTLNITTENTKLCKKFCTEHTDLTPGNYVRVTVKDTGYGMTPEIQQRIFEPYFTTKKESGKEGTGLGLAMVMGIVKNHKGQVYVESEPNKGTTFTIYLPKGSLDQETQRNDKVKIKKSEGTILLVDDEEIIRDVGFSMLETMGYKPITAKDGWEAAETYKKIAKETKAVILDISMPRMDGRDAYQIMKGMNPDIKVLITSGHASEGKVQQILDMGANGFLQKPFKKEQLYHALEKILK